MKKNQILSLLITIALVFSVFSINTFAAESTTEPTAEYEKYISSDEVVLDNNLNKLHFYFNNELNETIDDLEELDSAINSIPKKETTIMNERGVATEEKIDVVVEFESDFMKTKKFEKFFYERQNLKTAEDVLEFRKALNSYSLEYHNNLINKNLELLDDLDSSDIKIITYSPFVVAKVDADAVNTENMVALCDSEKIASISLGYELKAVATSDSESTSASYESFDSVLDTVNASDIISGGTCSGHYVRIGVLENDGICDVSNPNLSDKNITLRIASDPIDDHATEVTSIIALMVPDAEFYVSKFYERGLSWFIDNYCDVVNCSFSWLNNIKNADLTHTCGTQGYRMDYDAIFDYQIRAHYISVVVSSGNYNNDTYAWNYNPYKKVTSPGYAYNAITVGGVQRDLSTNEWICAENSCRNSMEPDIKPNVTAPFYVNVPNCGDCSGTSYSTAIVTGCVAMLLDYNPYYQAGPDAVFSIIDATAQRTSDYGNITGHSLKVGSGIINLDGMINIPHFVDFGITQNDNLSVVYSEEVYLRAGKEIQIGLAWMVEIDSGSNIQAVDRNDYDLHLYSPSGNVVYSRLTESNVEMIRFTATETGTYTFYIKLYGSYNTNVSVDLMSLSYRIT